ncbi:hypothetical protein [Alteromonas sp.]|uniref:hypothetical protein n=1 Tax=Alteromonas sp. TaxID=232 RepID=UPI00351179E0
MSEVKCLDRDREINELLKHLGALSMFLNEKTVDSEVRTDNHHQSLSNQKLLIQHIQKTEASLTQKHKFSQKLKNWIITLLDDRSSLIMEVTKLKAILIMLSEYFERSYYLAQKPDCSAQDFDCALHYLKEGWKLGLNPSENFDGVVYLEIYPDVQDAGINPLVHYLMYGQEEDRVKPRVVK